MLIRLQCHAWAVAPPKLLHFQIPQPLADQSGVATTFRSIDVNRTTVTAPQIASVILEDKYLETQPYEGFWHPFDGPLAKAGLVSAGACMSKMRIIANAHHRTSPSGTSSGASR